MLEIKNITKIFNLTGNEEDKKIALDNVSLTIHDGEFVTIIGGNGSGKSTLMNLISGVLQPDEGTILLNNVDITKETEYQKAKYLGRVFQDPMQGTAGDMSMLENLEIANIRGERHKLVWGFKKQNKAMYEKELSKFGLGLETRLNQKVKLLSGGQRQALTLLMATIKRPQLLLLDEHTAALDPKTAKKVLEFTNAIVSEEKLTTLMITHNMRDAITYGNRLIMLHNGHILHDFNKEEKEKLLPEDLLRMFDEADIKLEEDRV